MKTVFYTIISDSHYTGCRTDEMLASFRHFHPDIDFVVFGQKEIDAEFSKDKRLNFYNCKAHFARLLYDKYDLVVNADADHLILGPLTEILAADYDVACPANYNVFANANLKILSTNNNEYAIVSEMDYFQGGLIASTSKQFWDIYNYASIKHSEKLHYKENDVLNLVLQLFPFKTKYLEGSPYFKDEAFTCYYGCASLGREDTAYVENNQIKMNGRPMKAYHFARAGAFKIHPSKLFSKEVVDFIYTNIVK